MKIVIYETSDLHGFVNPTDYVKYEELGVLKIASFIKEDEKNYDYSLKIDCGDLIQGSAMTNYLSKTDIKENPIVNLLRDVGYDAFIIGNHEFNYGLDYLYNSYRNVKDKIINSNIKGFKLSEKPYKIFDINGYKIAVFGATTKFIPNWEIPANYKNIEFLDPIDCYGKYESELLGNSNLIICAYHGGFEKSLDGTNTPTETLTGENQASELLENFSSIDVMLSAHQHRKINEKINNTICTQVENNGKSFIKIVIDTDTNEITSDLLEVKDLNQDIDPKLEERFKDLNEKIEKYLDTKIGELSKDIPVEDKFMARLNGHPFINFLNEVQIDASGADFSALSMFDSAIGFKKDVTIRDILINYPYPNTLKVLEITGSKLKEAVEKSASYFTKYLGKIEIDESFLKPKVENYNYDMYYGFDYEIDLDKPVGSRVLKMEKDGYPIKMDKNYSIVLNNYRATNVSKYPAYKDAKVLREINLDMSEIIINYFEKHKKVKVDNTKNYIIK